MALLHVFIQGERNRLQNTCTLITNNMSRSSIINVLPLIYTIALCIRLML